VEELNTEEAAECDEADHRAQVTRGVLYARAEAEGTRLRNPYDTIVEGIGLNRLTANFARAQVDDAVRGSDQEAVSMVSLTNYRKYQTGQLAAECLKC